MFIVSVAPVGGSIDRMWWYSFVVAVFVVVLYVQTLWCAQRFFYFMFCHTLTVICIFVYVYVDVDVVAGDCLRDINFLCFRVYPVSSKFLFVDLFQLISFYHPGLIYIGS